MAKLDVTFIDVGWGDSILIEHEDAGGTIHRALVDCNDNNRNNESLAAYHYVKQHLELQGVRYGGNVRTFDFVLLTHWHSDHYSGLKRMMRTFGARRFWYPKVAPNQAMPAPLYYANRWNSRVDMHESVDRDKILTAAERFGDVEIEFHWPPHTQVGPFDPDNKNNNSVVLDLKLDRVRFMLTGDCEARNWDDIVPTISNTGIKLFQVPHHGGQNGMFVGNRTPWLDFLGSRTKIALSSHIQPHHHPHPRVVRELVNNNWRHYRTDEHYHVTFRTDGRRVQQKWARF